MSATSIEARNTPLLVQLYFFYFGVGTLMPQVMSSAGYMRPILDSFQWTVIALSLFGGAFNTEIFRAGIEAVPRTTIEAAEELGFSRLKIYIYVVLQEAHRPRRDAFRSRQPVWQRRLQALSSGPQSGAEHEQPAPITGTLPSRNHSSQA